MSEIITKRFSSSRYDLSLAVVILSLLFLVTTRYALTLAMIFLVTNAIFHKDVKAHVKAFLGNYVMLSITSVFLLYVLGGLYSNDAGYWMDRLRINLPFLIMPFAFASVLWTKQKIYMVLYSFILIILACCMISFGKYLLDYDTITEAYKTAKVLPTPINHVRFSLMVCFAIISGGYLFFEDKKKPLILKYLIAIALLFLLIYIHVLSVRSGLLSLYLCLLYLIIRYILTSKRYLVGIALLGILIATPYVAFHLLPSFKQKVYYMKYTMYKLDKGENLGNLSDAKRLISIRIGWEIFKESPVLGVGIGDLKQTWKDKYAVLYPQIIEKNRTIPHNQFIYVAAGFGVVGLLWFLLALLYPVLANQYYRNPLFMGFNIIIFSSFLVESTIEAQIGTAFYVLLLLLLVKYMEIKNA